MMTSNNTPPSSPPGEPISRRLKLKPVDRAQMVMRAIEVDQLVAADNPVRSIWAFVGQLDLGLFYEPILSREGSVGRSAHDPQVLICLWLWAYGEGIGSARELSRRCEDHPVCQWLTGLESINYHTLSDFRIGYHHALNDLFVQALGVLSAEGLITLKRVDHDGTKIRADVSFDSFRRGKTLADHLQAARQQVAALADPNGPETTPRQKAARKRAARERQDRLERAMNTWTRLDQNRRKNQDTNKDQEDKGNQGKSKSKGKGKEKIRVSRSEPDCRIMKHRGGGRLPSHNIQLTTDGERGLLVGVAATDHPVDQGLLEPGLDRVRENLGLDPDTAVTDGGYVNREAVLAMARRSTQWIAPPLPVKTGGLGRLARRGVALEFYPEHFIYNAEEDLYRCPAGQELPKISTEQSDSVIRHIYAAKKEVCRACPNRDRCCPGTQTRGRSITKFEERPQVADFQEKMNRPEIKTEYKRRGQLVEFPIAWIKEKMKFRRFHVRGRAKAGLEMLWVGLAYNLIQWIRYTRTPAVNG